MTRTQSKLAVQNNSKGMISSGGKGKGRFGLKRHARAQPTGISALGKPALRRLARRAGVKRINAGVYEEAPLALKGWLSKMIHDACVYAESARRFTITVK